jgi:hypothetical protein
MHAIIGFEEGSGQLEQRAVARVIKRFDAGYARRESRLHTFDVSHQLRLGACRSRDEYRTGLDHGLNHMLEEFRVDRRMTAIARIRLVVDVLIRMGTAYRRVIRLRRVEMKYFCFAVIDPDECVEVFAHKVPEAKIMTGGERGIHIAA